MWMRYMLAALSVCFVAGSWFAYRGTSASAPASEQVRQGMRLWQVSNCAACHQLYGLGGYMGPDLTNVHSAKGEAHIRTFVRYGTGRMPAHELSEEELDALVAFLAWVDASGRSRVPDSAVHWTGTFDIPAR
ncbi:MAG: cytochrome c [Flavobacteriales bacterium]|nr:cytochrome c [Flavobacteriales bacterium]